MRYERYAEPDFFAEKFLQQGADIIRPDICVVAGASEMRRIATIAEAHYVTFAPYNRMAAYDAYDIAKSAYEIHRVWNKIQTQFSGNDVYQTRPDVAITDEKGRLKDIYDFKMDNSETGFEEDWGGWSEGNVRQSGH